MRRRSQHATADAGAQRGLLLEFAMKLNRREKHTMAKIDDGAVTNGVSIAH